MQAKKHPLSHIRLSYRRSSPLVKCVVLVTILASILALVVLRVSIQTENGKQNQLQSQAAQLEQEKITLTRNIAELGTVESVKRIATLQLGLVDPDSQFFTPSN